MFCLKKNFCGTLIEKPLSIENKCTYIQRKLSIDLAKPQENRVFEVEYLCKDIVLEYIIKLVDSSPRKLQKILRAKGVYIHFIQNEMYYIKTFDF